SRAARLEPPGSPRRRLVGVRPLVREAAVGAAGVAHAAAAVRDRRRARPPARLRPHAGGRGTRQAGGRRGRGNDRAHRRHGRSLRGGRRGVPEVVGEVGPVHRRGGGAGRRGEVPGLDLRRAPDVAHQARLVVHALSAGGPRNRGDRRGDRRAALGGLRRGGEPAPHGQGVDGAHDGLNDGSANRSTVTSVPRAEGRDSPRTTIRTVCTASERPPRRRRAPSVTAGAYWSTVRTRRPSTNTCARPRSGPLTKYQSMAVPRKRTDTLAPARSLSA